MKIRNALILTGGFSSRLGRDKFMLNWHGKPQWEHLGELLTGLGLQVYISCRENQTAQFHGSWPLVADAYGSIGPAGGILSAMDILPGQGFLVVACDMPLLDVPAFGLLLSERDPDCSITAFAVPDRPGLAEPMPAIWEPRCHDALRTAVGSGNYGLQAIFKSAGKPNLILPPSEVVLTNVNTPEDLKRVETLLKRI